MENTIHHWETKMGNGEIEKGFRVFHTVNIGFVGQRAPKLPIRFESGGRLFFETSNFDS